MMQSLNETKRHAIPEFDVHDSYLRSGLTCQSFSVGCGGRLPSNDHSYFFEQRLNQYRDMPVILNDEDAHTP